MGRSRLNRCILVVTLLLLAGGLISPRTALGQGSTPTPATGYTYIVKRGDNWTRISRQTGIPIETLRQNNPQAIHPRDWLNEGERLFIPAPGVTSPSAPTTPAGGTWYQIKPGDSWGSVAKASGVSVQDLWSANPSKVNPNRWLFTGQWIWIPGPDAPSAPTEANPGGALTPVPTGSLTPATTPQATDAGLVADSQGTVDVSGQAGATVAAASQTAATAAAAAQSAAAIAAAVNNIATAAAVAQSAATSIAVLSTQVVILSAGTEGVIPAEMPGMTDNAEPAQPALIATATATPIMTATATPIMTATATPVAPLTSTPVASRTPTRPAPTATRTAVSTRAATATPTGVCLLDQVLAANRAFDRWGQEGFEEPIQLYWAAVSDTAVLPCGKTTAQMEQLRDYARFRLLVSYVAGGQARQAPPLRDQIKDARLKGAADTFLDGLKTSGSIVQSCRDVTEYVKKEPAGWRWLSEMGLPAKPADVCPLG